MPPKQTQPFEMNRFVKGLVTEASPLNFPADATVEEFNFTLDKTGRRIRRLGMDYELGHVMNSTEFQRNERNNLAINTYVWTNVGEDATLSFAVVQIGSWIYFHARENEILSTAPVGSVQIGTAKTQVFSFTGIDGDLVVANGKGYITRVSYDEDTVSFNTETFRLKVRDQWGLEDVIDSKDLTGPDWINFRPTSTTDNHTYNLRNQGWSVPRLVKEFDQQLLDPLDKSVTQFDYNRYPSNADVMHEWVRPDPDGSEQRRKFFSRDYQREPPFTTPTAKGYFVIDLLQRGSSRTSVYNQNMVKHPELVTDLGAVLNQDHTTGGATCVEEFSGRVFYAGFGGNVIDPDEKSPRLSSYVAFSQLVNSPDQLGLCYQAGDPTSPDESDLLATDGGVIRISGAEKIIDLKQVGRSLFVVATNGMWRISGGSDYGFSADNYEVEKVTEHGPVNRDSVVEVDDTFMFWSDNGIYHVVPTELGGYKAQNLSNVTIQTFYDDISPENKSRCRSVFDRYERQVRWLYPDSEDDQTGYDNMRELIYDVELQAFTVNAIYNTNGPQSPIVHAYIVAHPFTREVEEQGVTVSDDVLVGGDSVVIGEEVLTTFENVPTIKYLTFQYTDGTGTGDLEYSFAEYNEVTWKDWGTEDAAAWMVTGAFIGGDSSRHKQQPYLHFHMEKDNLVCIEEEGSPECFPYACDAYEGVYDGTTIDRVHLVRAPLESFDWWGATFYGDPNKWHGWSNYIAGPVVSDSWAGIFSQEDVSGWSWINDDTNLQLCGGAVTVATNKNAGFATSAMTYDSNASFGNSGGSWGSYSATFIFAGHQGGPVGTQNVAWELGKVYQHGARQNPGTGSGTRVINPDFRVLIVSEGGGLYTLRIQMDYGHGSIYNPTYGTRIEIIDFTGLELDERWNIISIETGQDFPYVGISSERADRSAVFMNFSVKVRLNGVEYERSATWEEDYHYEQTSPLVKRNARPLYEGPVFWRDAEITLGSADIEVKEDGALETETNLLHTAFDRNFTSYEIPAYCETDVGFGVTCTSGESSCLVRTSWDHAIGSTTGRISPPFQVYREVRGTDGDYEVVTTRNRVRGRGKSMFMRMDTEPDKGCRILGWNLSITGNSHV